ncbi:zinc ribbon domain-containing protein [Thermodesulfatator indicus]|uniref:zinc ribbon domain-containing protein n=1 Tax=Thermodesulfatator indicus TaxID=171695 RepID=UPI00059D0844|nr:zinc ribbon domain-containing protein [Thermodesulfatator indicus]
MVSEVKCLNCGKRFKLKGESRVDDFLSLPCPECGGTLEPIKNKQSEKEDLVDTVDEPALLIDKSLALVFWDIAEEKGKLLKDLIKTGYEVRLLKKPSLLTQWLRFETPALVVLAAEEEKIRPYIDILNSLPMPERRQIFVVWITDKARTLDPRPAFLASVEIVVNTSDIPRFSEILNRGQKIWRDFYYPFKQVEESLAKEI